MDVRSAVKSKENYAAIVEWFRSMGTLNTEELVLLVDTIGEMSEEIFEYYKALCDILRIQLQSIRKICQEKGCQEAFPDSSQRSQLSYVVAKACGQGIVLAEKYEELAEVLQN